MVRMLIRFGIQCLANALGLIVASLILDDFSLNSSGFILAVLIFTGASIILQPLMTKISLEHARALQGGTALVTTLISLIITDIFSDGMSITGGVTWLLSTLIVWLASLLAVWLLPLILVKRAVNDNSNNRTRTFGR